MFTKDIKNIINNYIKLSVKKILTIEKKLLEKYVYVLIRHNNFKENKILGIFTSFDKMNKYRIRDGIIFLNNDDNIQNINSYIQDHYIYYYTRYNISRQLYQFKDIYLSEIYSIEEFLTHNKEISFCNIPIEIDPVIEINKMIFN